MPPPTPEIYTLSLHDALPILRRRGSGHRDAGQRDHFAVPGPLGQAAPRLVERERCRALDEEVDHVTNRRESDRKSTRLNSSHQIISYAVFCLKKKTRATTNET